MLRVREARDADAPGVIALIERVFAEYPGCVLDVDGEEPALRAPASGFDRFWVAEDEAGSIAGTVALSLGDDHVELKKLYVDRAHRRTGLGTRLVALVEAVARAAGVPRIELWSDTRFEAAHAFYGRLGYEKTGRQRDLNDRSNTREHHFRKLLR